MRPLHRQGHHLGLVPAGEIYGTGKFKKDEGIGDLCGYLFISSRRHRLRSCRRRRAPQLRIRKKACPPQDLSQELRRGPPLSRWGVLFLLLLLLRPWRCLLRVSGAGAVAPRSHATTHATAIDTTHLAP